MKKKARSLEYKALLLKNCKTHGGPFTDLQELETYVNSVNDEKKLKKDLRQEIGFQKMLHPVDAKERNHLYKMNFLIPEEMVENLCILLDNDIESNEGEVVTLPSEEDIMEILSGRTPTVATTPAADDNDNPVFTHLQPLAVVWDANDGKRYWSIGFFLNEIDEITIRVDHLLRKGNTSQNGVWVRPEHDDIQEVKTDYQVIPCNVNGDWIDLNSRVPKFKVNNTKEIEKAFENYA